MDVNDIGTGLAILGTAEVSKDAVQRMLAPTADYIGAGVLQGTKAAVNTARVFAKAARRLGPRIDDGGQVPPRVLKNVLDEAPWIDDELIAEYLGGILASSFGDRVFDDRAVALQSTLSRLSSYSIKAHYACYSQYYLLYKDRVQWSRSYDDLDNTQMINDTAVYGPHREFARAWDISYDDSYYYSVRLHAFASLGKEELVTPAHYGSREYLKRTLAKEKGRYDIPEDGQVYYPTGPGEELFVWALGRGDLSAGPFPEVDLDVDVPGVPVLAGFRCLEDLRIIDG